MFDPYYVTLDDDGTKVSEALNRVVDKLLTDEPPDFLQDFDYDPLAYHVARLLTSTFDRRELCGIIAVAVDRLKKS